jgi:hypothetical protein
VILNVLTPRFGEVVIEASDGVRYHADLGPLSQVYCYPRTEEEWQKVAIDSYGLGLVWTTRFEVHVDQVIGLADRREPLERAG